MLYPAGALWADQISCVADGKGKDSCDVTYPNVLAAKTAYPNMVFQKGDVVTITAQGCAQTGGSGSTWKQYVNPMGSNADHMYHGLISIPGTTSGMVRLATVVGKTLPASTGGALSLGYEDDSFGDNGYYSHDDGDDDQCKDQSGPTEGRASIHMNIVHAGRPVRAAGTVSGMCQIQDSLHEQCHIDRPDVTHATETYSSIVFQPADDVIVEAQGCVQTGGSGPSWKRYVNPSGNNSDHLYHGLISIPGLTTGYARISTINGKALSGASGGVLRLGYEDDNHGDNGFYKHDDGTEDQCKGMNAASLDIRITHHPAHVVVDALEVTQVVQDLDRSVPLVAQKDTWLRAYLSGAMDTGSKVTATLQATVGSAVVDLNPQAPITVTSGTSIITERQNFGSSLNYHLPASVTKAGVTNFQLTSVRNAATGAAIPCDLCTPAASRTFTTSPALLVHILSMTYTSGTPATTYAPTRTDVSLLTSWLGRAYPVATVTQSTVTVASNNAWPFTCNLSNAQIAAIRANDVSNGRDSHTHYIALVSNGAGFLRGCASGVPASPDPTTVASAPAGPPTGSNVPVNVAGDTDGSFADWYGGHEMSHTFGRAHPGFCNGNSASDPSFPYPNGQISDNKGTDTGFDVGAGTAADPLTILPGATRFDIMTYCNQPQWMSAYTYEGIRTRLFAEYGMSTTGGAGGGGSGGAEPGSFVHVVASVNLSTGTGKIRYVSPTTRSMPQPGSTLHGELRLMTADGKAIVVVPVAIREDTDIPEGEAKTALVDAFIPYSKELGKIQLAMSGKVMDEFAASQRPPETPLSLTLSIPPGLDESSGVYQLTWDSQGEGEASTTYTVEGSGDGKSWTTVAIGVRHSAVRVGLEVASMKYLRVKETNGWMESAPETILGLHDRPPAKPPGRPSQTPDPPVKKNPPVHPPPIEHPEPGHVLQ